MDFRKSRDWRSAKDFTDNLSEFSQFYKRAIIIPILQMSKRRPEEAKTLTQGDTALSDSHVAISVTSYNAWLPSMGPLVPHFGANIHEEGLGNTKVSETRKDC